MLGAGRAHLQDTALAPDSPGHGALASRPGALGAGWGGGWRCGPMGSGRPAAQFPAAQFPAAQFPAVQCPGSAPKAASGRAGSAASVTLAPVNHDTGTVQLSGDLSKPT